MVDSNDDIHIFEVKSVNLSSNLNIDNAEYENKIRAIKKGYEEASRKLPYYFYLPIQKENDWQITQYFNGEEKTFSYKEFKNFLINR